MWTCFYLPTNTCVTTSHVNLNNFDWLRVQTDEYLTGMSHVIIPRGLENVNMTKADMWHGARRHQIVYYLTLYLHQEGGD